jgi:hypothetical protein
MATNVAAQDMDIVVSRFGYNLLWPTTRCCAFELHLPADGAGTLTVKRNGGSDPITEKHRVTLSPVEMTNLKRTLEAADFFSLPKEICCGPVDGDLQRISVRLAGRSHQVTFGEGASDNHQSEHRRVLKVWRTIKDRFKIEGENVERSGNAF